MLLLAHDQTTERTVRNENGPNGIAQTNSGHERVKSYIAVRNGRGSVVTDAFDQTGRELMQVHWPMELGLRECGEGCSATAVRTSPLAAVCLALFVAFWLELDNPFGAGTSAAIVCQPQLGASLARAGSGMVGTLIAP